MNNLTLKVKQMESQENELINVQKLKYEDLKNKYRVDVQKLTTQNIKLFSKISEGSHVNNKPTEDKLTLMKL